MISFLVLLTLSSRLFSVHHFARLLISSQYEFSSLFVMGVQREPEGLWCWALEWRRCDCQSELSGVCLWESPISSSNKQEGYRWNPWNIKGFWVERHGWVLVSTLRFSVEPLIWGSFTDSSKHNPICWVLGITLWKCSRWNLYKKVLPGTKKGSPKGTSRWTLYGSS